MCNQACISFFERAVTREDIENKRILEVGSLDVNGSVRPLIESYHPREYIGIDIQKGAGVDEVCDAKDILKRFGGGRFDVLISSETLEHIRDCKTAIRNIKHVVAPGGLLFITAPSYGKVYHAYPHDYWRYEVDDMKKIFSDCIVEHVENNPNIHGTYLKARKPTYFQENNISQLSLYSIVCDKRVKKITNFDLVKFFTKKGIKKVLPSMRIS